MPRSRWISDLHWVRPGRQSRSRQTQEALLDAAEELFSEKGVEAASVADVAARAGCSVGAVYHHFRDKSALLYALLARLSESFRATTRDAVDPARWQGATIADVLRGYLEFSIESGRSRPGLQRATLEATLRDPDLRAHLGELRDELARGLTALLLARRKEIGHPDPELAVAFVLDQLGAMLRARLDSVLFHAPLAACSDERFVAETLRGVCGYLQIGPPQDLESPA
jgi:AcrR family transcriptional regulator